MHLVEGMFYQNPHYPELVAEHPAMVGVWRKCASLIGKGVVMAPLLVDDRPQEGMICGQTIESLLNTTTGRKYESFPWLGPQISEAQLEVRHGTSSCYVLYAEYHMQVMWYLNLLQGDWLWTKVHPISFQETNARTLGELWKRIGVATQLSVIAGSVQTPQDDFRTQVRESLFSHFRHYWVAGDGQVVSHTRPVWKKGKVVHEPTPSNI